MEIIFAFLLTIICSIILYGGYGLGSELVEKTKNRIIVEFLLKDYGLSSITFRNDIRGPSSFSDIFFKIYKNYFSFIKIKKLKPNDLKREDNYSEFSNTYYALNLKHNEFSNAKETFSFVCIAIMLSPVFLNCYEYNTFIKFVSQLGCNRSSFIPISTTEKIYEICSSNKNTYKNEALFYNRIYCSNKRFTNQNEVFEFCITICNEIINGDYSKESKEEIIKIKELFESEISTTNP